MTGIRLKLYIADTAAIFYVIILLICIADARQQNNFRYLQEGYDIMETGNYEEAAEVFSTYLSFHDSELYW